MTVKFPHTLPVHAVSPERPRQTRVLGRLQDTLSRVLIGKAHAIELFLAGILSGALDDTALADGAAGFAQGHFIMAVDIAKFMPVEIFRRRTAAFIAAVKATPKANGVEEIFLPGEQSWHRWQDRKQNGIPLSNNLVAELTKLGASLGVAFDPDGGSSGNAAVGGRGLGTAGASVR